MIEKIDTAPHDEYDKALIFALKKWIADEINNIYDNGVYAVCLTMEKGEKWQAGIGYSTEAFAKAGGSKWNICGWKCPDFSNADNDGAVDGMIDMWLDFKGFGKVNEDDVKDGYFRCAAQAVKELTADFIIKERFNRNIPFLLVSDREEMSVIHNSPGAGGKALRTAAFTMTANPEGLIDESFYEMCGV